MLQIPKVEAEPYIAAAIRRKWWIVVPFVVCIVLGLMVYFTSPKIYRASTLILVEPKSIPDAYVRSTVTDSVDRILRTILQQVHSRTNLEDIIKRFNLLGDKEEVNEGIMARIKKLLGKTDPLEKDDRAGTLALVERLREAIDVKLSGRDRSQAFEITFEWHDPEVAAQVTNAMASKFIEENLNVREEIAMTTTDFLDRETARIRQELETREKELEGFKKENMGMLPGELESNINILNQLKDEQNNLEKRLDMEKQTALMLESQMQMQSSMTGLDTGALFSIEDETAMEGPGSGVEALEAELQNLRLRYTEQHPDIVALKKRIEAAREKEKEELRSTANTSEPAPEPMMSAADMIASQKDAINQRIEGYMKQIEDIKKQMQAYKDRVERTPQVELAMTKIMRDYDTVRARYDALLAKKLDARMAEDLERRQKGEQFRVLDPAIRPEKPFAPDFKKIMFMAIIAGLGLGGGLAYVREVMDPRFYSPEEVETYLGAQVIINLPVANMDPMSGANRKTG